MTDYLIFFYLGVPIIGYLIGSFPQTRFLNGHTAIKTSGILLATTVLFNFVDITFKYDSIDYLIVIFLCFFIGYSSTQLKNENNSVYKRVIILSRFLIFGFYITTPISAYFLLVTALGNNDFESIVHVEQNENYHIKHIRKGSGYASTGKHIARVYSDFLIIEYRITEFDLGDFGVNGYNIYTSINGTQRPTTKAIYNKNKNTLTLYEYDQLFQEFHPIKTINSHH